MPPLLAVPNFSEGRDRRLVEEIAAAAVPGRVLDLHCDADHGRSVVTLTAGPGELAAALLRMATLAVERIDLRRAPGQHPRVGALDVAPIVHLTPAERGAACAEALVLGDRLGEELGLPVLLYGALAGGRTRAELRRGGVEVLARRLEGGELRADFGPSRAHPTAGAVLLAARPPLVAFNVELGPGASREDARAVAARIREGGDEGLPGVRAIGVWLAARGVAQVSTNVEDPLRVPLGDVVAAVARHAAVAGTELVGLAPAVAFTGFPEDVPVRGRRTVEEALRG